MYAAAAAPEAERSAPEPKNRRRRSRARGRRRSWRCTSGRATCRARPSKADLIPPSWRRSTSTPWNGWLSSLCTHPPTSAFGR
ncbi:unnamed protein product, partial [Effrenium voratum]